LKDKTHLRNLGTIQRTALIRILSALRTGSTSTVEVESHTLPTNLRLKQRAQTVIARLSTLPKNHTVYKVISRAHERSYHVRLNPRFPLAETMKTRDLHRLWALETIDPSPLAPWRASVFQDIGIEQDREKAMDFEASGIAGMSLRPSGKVRLFGVRVEGSQGHWRC
jgi:hypothetical protein